MCKGNHQAMKMGTDPDCIRRCVGADKSVKYVLLDGNKTYKLNDQKTPQGFAGQRIRITGTLYEKTGVLDVQQIQPVRQ
jgi:Protein of unknown function (DUF5818)